MTSKTSRLVLACLLILGGCSHPAQNGGLGFGQISNIRETGVVLAQRQVQSTNTEGIARSLDVAGGAQSPVYNSQGQVIGAQTSTFAFLSSMGNSFSSNKMDEVLTIEYVIQKDNGGGRILVDQTPSENEPIMYPGDKVMIQTNGNFTRLYPGDVEHRRGYNN